MIYAMKKITSVILLVFLTSSILTYSGCKKSDTPAPDPTPSGPLSVTIGGTPLVFSNVIASRKQAVLGNVTKNYILIMATIVNSNDYLALSVFNEEINSNISVDLANSNSWDIVKLDGSSVLNANHDLIGSGASGTLTLTKNDTTNKRIEGSFTCVMINGQGGKAPVVKGSFAIDYVKSI